MLEYADPMLSFRRGVSGVLCAVGLLLSGACAARSPQTTTVQAPQQVVAPQPAPAAAAQPDPVQELIALSEQHFQAGERELSEGHLDAATAAFDRAVDVLLESPGGARSNPQLSAHYDRLIERISGHELTALAQADGFAEKAPEPASIDDLLTIIFLRNTLASGVVPQISASMGPCAGGAVYSPAITDFILMVEGHELHVHHRPRGHQGGDPRGGDQGVSGGAADPRGEERRLPPHRAGRPASPRRRCASCSRSSVEQPGGPAACKPSSDPPLREVPELDWTDPARVEQALRREGRHSRGRRRRGSLRDHRQLSRNIVVGFARIGGRPSASSRTSPRCSPVSSTSTPSLKAARFVRFCDCFNIPLVTFVDVPGFLPGTDQEYGGIIVHGAKLLFAFAEATVPKLTVILRKAYGGAYDVMASKHIRADVNLAFPTAEIAVMGPDGAVNIVYREEIQNAADPEQTRAAFVADYREKFANPYKAAELGFIDEVIYPRTLRSVSRVARAVEGQARHESGEEAHEYSALKFSESPSADREQPQGDRRVAVAALGDDPALVGGDERRADPIRAGRRRAEHVPGLLLAAADLGDLAIRHEVARATREEKRPGQRLHEIFRAQFVHRFALAPHHELARGRSA